MYIHEFLRAARMKRGLMSYQQVVTKAVSLGFTTSTQALNKAERLPQYMMPSTRQMYVQVYQLSHDDADMLDVLSAQCQVRKGTNTNPYMRVVDERVFKEKVDRCVDLAINLVATKTETDLKEAEVELLKTAMEGLLRCALTPTSS